MGVHVYHANWGSRHRQVVIPRIVSVRAGPGVAAAIPLASWQVGKVLWNVPLAFPIRVLVAFFGAMMQ